MTRSTWTRSSRLRYGVVIVAALLFGAATLATTTILTRPSPRPAQASAADLGIGNTPGLGRTGIVGVRDRASRPGILVAWRNTQRVLEIETLVQNHGQHPANGRLTVEILNGEHQVLAKQPPASRPFVVTVPPVDAGGSIGITAQVPGTYGLNQLLDGTDRARDPYCLRLQVETLGLQDGNLFNNTSVKCYNNSAKLVSGGIASHQYVLRNTSLDMIKGSIVVPDLKPPDGWTVEMNPAPGSKVTLAPGASMVGSVIVRAQGIVQEGQYLDVRPTLALADNRVVDQSEFFVAADRNPPRITDAYVAPGRDSHSVYLSVRALDPISGVAEASGAAVEWSSDGGLTKSQRTMTYEDGNFLSPTGFDTDLGPFVDGTALKLAVTVNDVLGNRSRTKEMRIQLPLKQKVGLTP
jgi:hypothetical protein